MKANVTQQKSGLSLKKTPYDNGGPVDFLSYHTVLYKKGHKNDKDYDSR